MFNLRQGQLTTECKPFTPEDLLLQELRVLNVHPHHDRCELDIGDERVIGQSIKECLNHLKFAIKELKEHLWEAWKDLGHLAKVIAENGAGNNGGLDNLIFLNAVKKSFLLSRKFSDLDEVTSDIEKLFHIDAAEVHEKLIVKFNMKYIEIRVLHHLIMHEVYRSKVMSRYSQLKKQAQISGPWANLDLPMKERVWEWEEDEEYQENRTKARREQTRYNPEYDKQGFFFVWQDLTRDPYTFEDFKKDAPYKSRHLITIP